MQPLTFQKAADLAESRAFLSATGFTAKGVMIHYLNANKNANKYEQIRRFLRKRWKERTLENSKNTGKKHMVRIGIAGLGFMGMKAS